MAEPSKKTYDFENASVGSKYSFGKELGRGANGIVMEGTDRVTFEKVAIKTSVANERFPDSIAKETLIYKVLQGLPGIPRLIAHGQDFFVLEKLGDSLYDILLKRRYASLTLRSILLIVDQLLCCIESMHSRDVFHNDLKITNVLMGLGSKSNIVHIIDFGSAIHGPPKAGTVDAVLKRIDMTQVGHLIVDLFQGVSIFRRFSEMPEEVGIFKEYCKTVKCDIDYEYLKQTFENVFEKNGFTGNVIFE